MSQPSSDLPNQEPTESGGVRRVADAIDRAMPTDPGPIQAPWELSISTVLSPHVPDRLARGLRMLDRFGAVRVSPDGIGFDASKVIPWSKVVEIHTLPLLEVATDATVGGAVHQVAARVPMLPRSVRDKVAERTAEYMGALVGLALDRRYGELAGRQVPVVIQRRRLLFGTRSISAGAFASAVLAHPRLARCVFATAHVRGVPIYRRSG